MTLQARTPSQPRVRKNGASHVAADGRAIARLAHLAATERAATVTAAITRHICETLGADGALVLEYGTTPGRLTVTAGHGNVDLQPGARIPASPLLTPSTKPEAASIIDASARAALPGSEKPRALMAAPIPGPYAASGSVVALFNKSRDFSDDELALLETAAALVGAAQQKEAASSELAGSLESIGGVPAPGRSREHAVLAGMARAAAESPDLDTALASICEWTAELVPYDRMVFGLVDADASSFTRSVFVGEEIAGRPAGERCIVTADELDELARPRSEGPEPAVDAEIHGSSLRAPVICDGRLTGVMWLGSRAANGYSGSAMESLCRIAEYVAPIVDAARNRDRSKHAARDAGDSAQQLAAVLSAAPVALVAVDAAGMCTLVEGRLVRDMGAIGSLLKGHSLFELTGRHPQVEEAVRAALRGAPGSAVLRVGRRSLELSIQPVLGAAGGIDGAIIVGTDVTERTAGRAALAEVKQLQLAQDERARLMSAVSHELRTPLTSIVAFIDILALNQPGNLTPEQAQALSVVQKSAERLNRLIGDLHDLSKMEAGMFTLDVKLLDVSALLQYLTDTHQPLLAARQQSLVVENLANDWEVAADELRVSQAVSNLLSNASKYSAEGSTVTLNASVADGHLEVAVIDNGPGIPEQYRSRVFDAFYRIENEHTKVASGSGLGLAIVKRIVELHGGAVDLQSGPDGGTAVSISLPGAQRK